MSGVEHQAGGGRGGGGGMWPRGGRGGWGGRRSRGGVLQGVARGAVGRGWRAASSNLMAGVMMGPRIKNRKFWTNQNRLKPQSFGRMLPWWCIQVNQWFNIHCILYRVVLLTGYIKIWLLQINI